MSKRKGKWTAAKAAAMRIMRQTPKEDPHGSLPPGLRPQDAAMVGTKGAARFTGHFYGLPDIPWVQFERPVIVWFASRDILVLQDLEHGNLYVVDRRRDLSLGCLMSVRFIAGREADTTTYTQRVAANV